MRASANPGPDGAVAAATVEEHRIGLILNPRSHAHKGNATWLAEVLGRHPGVAFAAPDDTAALRDALDGFAARRVGLVIVSGGDGTIREVLSALPGAYGCVPPRLAVLAAGNTNMVARALGRPGRGPQGLERLLAAARAGTLRQRSYPVLEVSWKGEPERTAMRGFLLGAAALVDGKRIADTRIHARGLNRGAAVLMTVGLTVLRTLAGGALRRTGTPMRVGLDGSPPRPGHRFLLLATTLDRPLFGFSPFWGAGEGAIQVLDIDAPARRLPAAAFAVLRRRAPSWLAAEGYRSARAGSVRIEMDQPFLLDGEHFDPGRDGVVLSAPASITFAFP